MKVAVFDHMDECTETEVQRLLPLVSAQRREQALRYRHLLGQFCCLKSWLMLYDLMDEKTRGWMDEWDYNEYGKPSFRPSPLCPVTPYFSISHCKQGIAVVLDDVPVGIDIESIRHAEMDLLNRVMSEEERLLIANKPKTEADRTFTRLWTQKEALVKAQGVGIQSFEQLQTLPLSSFEIQTIEKEKYIYSIAYGKLHCFGA